MQQHCVRESDAPLLEEDAGEETARLLLVHLIRVGIHSQPIRSDVWREQGICVSVRRELGHRSASQWHRCPGGAPFSGSIMRHLTFMPS